MSPGGRLSLTRDQMESLASAASLGIASAAEGLAEMTGKAITMAAPKVSISPLAGTP